MRRFFAVFVTILLVCVSSIALADEWVCPNCGRVNPDRANFCGGCRESRPTELGVLDHIEYNAWICPECGNICSTDDSFCMICASAKPSDFRGALLIEHDSHNREIVLPHVDISDFSVNFSDKSDQVFYVSSYTGGKCSVWVTDVTSSYNRVNAVLKDTSGKKIADRDGYNYALKDGGGGMSANLNPNQEYKLYLNMSFFAMDFKPGSATIHIGYPREAYPINEKDVIYDSFDYPDQQNQYEFSPTISGVYAFTCTEAYGGMKSEIHVSDDRGDSVEQKQWYQEIGMGDYVSFQLEAGKRYIISACQSSGLGEYTLQVGYPSKEVEITGCNAVGDELYYGGQENRYVYTAQGSGDYQIKVECQDRRDGCYLTVYDPYNNRMNSYSNVYSLENGRRYTLIVTNERDWNERYRCDYTITIEPDNR